MSAPTGRDNAILVVGMVVGMCLVSVASLFGEEFADTVANYFAHTMVWIARIFGSGA